jgi:quercetin dioxygenase-like cupin family protein
MKLFISGGGTTKNRFRTKQTWQWKPFPNSFWSKRMAFKYFPDVKTKVIFSPEGPQPQSLYTEGQLKVITAGLNAGQKIPVHPEGLAVYIFLEGHGWMVVDGQRLEVSPGSTIITQAGAQRGIEAESQLVFIAARITELFHWILEINLHRMMVSIILFVAAESHDQNPYAKPIHVDKNRPAIRLLDDIPWERYSGWNEVRIWGNRPNEIATGHDHGTCLKGDAK